MILENINGKKNAGFVKTSMFDRDTYLTDN